MENQKVLNMRLPAKLYDELKEVAEKKNISMSAFIRMALTEYIEQQKKK